MSLSGRSRPFHAEADGLVPASQVAVFLEKIRDATAAPGEKPAGIAAKQVRATIEVITAS